MEAEQPIVSTRPGTPGLDVFKIAGRSISGFVHSFKTGDPRRVRQPFTSHLEEQLSMFLEYHPHVRFYQRGDASPACANTYGLVTELGTPYRINYVFDGKPHEYLPDYVKTKVNLLDPSTTLPPCGCLSVAQRSRLSASLRRARPFSSPCHLRGLDSPCAVKRQPAPEGTRSWGCGRRQTEKVDQPGEAHSRQQRKTWGPIRRLQQSGPPCLPLTAHAVCSWRAEPA